MNVQIQVTLSRDRSCGEHEFIKEVLQTEEMTITPPDLLLHLDLSSIVYDLIDTALHNLEFQNKFGPGSTE